MRRRPLVLVGLLAGLFVYEIVAAVTAPPGDTLSEIVWRLSSRPIVPFACGILAGHFFWPRRIDRYTGT
jgi:hypothetical protein